MSISDPTYIGQVASVSGANVSVKLRDDVTSTLIMIKGESYRIGQIGGFYRIPLGYANLYGICTHVGANAIPHLADSQIFENELEISDNDLSGFRWITIVLIGEGIANEFERGVGQYPTVGDEVHLVTKKGLKTIYGRSEDNTKTISVGHISVSSNIPANINVSKFVSRHGAILGSTGAGKSNLVTVLLEELSGEKYTNSRILVVDPHGEYSSALGDKAKVFSINTEMNDKHYPLWVPFWALPFEEIQKIVYGNKFPHEFAIRDIVQKMKTSSANLNKIEIPEQVITADSPIPFSIKQLWFELDKNERITFNKSNNQDESCIAEILNEGNAETLQSAVFQPAGPGGAPPFLNKGKRVGIEKPLEELKSKLCDSRFSFLFSPQDGYMPDLVGKTKNDLDELVFDWVGHDKPITIFDVSKLPSEVLTTVVGTMIKIIYETLFWAQQLPIGGREQPLLVVIDEAHQFLPEGKDEATHRTLSKVAKEGRKYGIGLLLVTQRPTDIDSTILSQCGSIFALRTTNSADRSRVSSAMPDELEGLISQLPALRTGEGIFIGEMMPIPSRVRIREANRKPVGNDPKLPDVWLKERLPDKSLYKTALENWRSQKFETEPKMEKDHD